jgi:hypothetical protein
MTATTPEIKEAHSKAVGVLVPMPAPRPYTYAVPEGWQVEAGSIVQVPLGPRLVSGVVWDGASAFLIARHSMPRCGASLNGSPITH